MRVFTPILSRSFYVLLGLLGLALVSCRPTATPTDEAPVSDLALVDQDRYRPGEDEFSVMTYNTLRYSLEDRDHDGQRDDPKPPEERDALISLIAEVDPDVLALEEIGDAAIFAELKQALETAGLAYGFEEFLQRNANSDRQVNLAVLSRLPIVSHQSHTDDVYTIGDAKDVPVARGFIDVDIGVNPAYRFKLMVAHLKSKVYHELGQTEMRRNEARLLNKHVRTALKEDPRMNLLVVGDLNDTYESRAIREVIGNQTPYLFDLRPKDFVGDAWTHFRRRHDEYSRIDYMLASEYMLPEVVTEKTRVVRDPRTYQASDHRPVVAVFRAQDVAPR